MTSKYSRLIKEVLREAAKIPDESKSPRVSPDERVILDLIFHELRNNRQMPTVRAFARAFSVPRSTTFVRSILRSLIAIGLLREDPEHHERAIVLVLNCSMCNNSGRIADSKILDFPIDNEDEKNLWYFMVDYEITHGIAPTARMMADHFGVALGTIAYLMKGLRAAGALVDSGDGARRLRSKGVVPCPACVMQPQPWETP